MIRQPPRIVFAFALLAAGAALAPRFAHAGHAHIRNPVSIPMRDTPNTLAADVYLPVASGQWPAIVIQTPYNKDLMSLIFTLPFGTNPLLESPDYAFVVVDWRGFFDSSSAAYFGNPTRGEDGYDVVEWTAQQAWCTGAVGTWGESALGTVQLKTAQERPPHLLGCVPMAYHNREWYDQSYPGGVYSRNRNDFVYGLFGGLSLVRAHPLDDAYWQIAEDVTGDPSLVDVPMLHITGWYDHETIQTIREMHDVQVEGDTNAAGKQKLLIGPWTHGSFGQSNQGELEYPVAEHADAAAALQFFDHYLRGIDSGYASEPIVRYFRMNADAWEGAPSWPPAGTATETYYLNPSGGLDISAPTAPSAHLEYAVDPNDPVPTVFGAVVMEGTSNQGPGDLTTIEARGDVLTFTTPVLTDALTIEGEGSAHLYVSCTAVDTDLAVRITEVYPDDRSMLLVDGIRRASLRHGFSSHQYLTPGTIYPIQVDLPPVSVTIPVGHRLRISVAPSNYDRFDVNMQDGSDLSDEVGAMATPSTVRIYMDASNPSRLDLPIAASPDSDGDGLTDAEEVIWATDPDNPDSDSDGLTDGDEVNVYGTSPTDPDTDHDGYPDQTEILLGSDPTDTFDVPTVPISPLWLVLSMLSAGVACTWRRRRAVA